MRSGFLIWATVHGSATEYFFWRVWNWPEIKNIDALEEMRMNAMRLFLNDFDRGKAEGRYIYHELPNKTKYQENTFDIGISSHFLLMYTGLGYDFHIQTINEMLLICKEIRITPVVDLDGKPSELTERICHCMDKQHILRNIEKKWKETI